MRPLPLDPQAFLWPLADLVLLTVGVVFPLLFFARAAELDGIRWLSVETLAYAFYAACAIVYGREVLIAGGWACVGFGAILIAREVYRVWTERARPG